MASRRATPTVTDPGDASLPEGWQSLSYASRRELMFGTNLPLQGGIVGTPLHPDAERFKPFVCCHCNRYIATLGEAGDEKCRGEWDHE